MANKLSDTITKFAEPLLEKCSNFKDQEKTLSLSIIAWNMCIVPQEEADNLRKILHKEICKNDKQAIKNLDEIIDYLILRKNASSKMTIVSFFHIKLQNQNPAYTLMLHTRRKQPSNSTGNASCNFISFKDFTWHCSTAYLFIYLYALKSLPHSVLSWKSRTTFIPFKLYQITSW